MIYRLLQIFIFIMLSGIATAQVGIQVPAGHTVKIDAHGSCRQVTNLSSGTRLVFTGTAAEWNSFINYPNGLALNSCTVPCHHNGQIYQEGQVAMFYKYLAQGGNKGQCSSSTQKSCQNGVFVSSSSFYDSYIYETCTWLPRTYGTGVVGCSSGAQPDCPPGVDDGNYHSIPCYDPAFSCSIKNGACNSWKTIICRTW